MKMQHNPKKLESKNTISNVKKQISDVNQQIIILNNKIKNLTKDKDLLEEKECIRIKKWFNKPEVEILISNMKSLLKSSQKITLEIPVEVTSYVTEDGFIISSSSFIAGNPSDLVSDLIQKDAENKFQVFKSQLINLSMKENLNQELLFIELSDLLA